MDYDDDPEPTIDEIKNLISKSFDRFESVRKNNNFSSDTVIIIDFDEEELVSISSKGEGFKFFKNNDVPKYEKYVKMQLDKKLLKRLLEGPSKAHWNIAEGGSHIYFERVPDVYERSLFYNFYYFYA